MAITTVIFDFDGVLSDYDVSVRLNALAQLTRISEQDVYERVWASGFEEAADSGEYETGETYLNEFNVRLGVSLSDAQWVEARRSAMVHRPDMHTLAASLSERYNLALLSNNGPLTKQCFAQLAPQTAQLFGASSYFSFEFATKKPNPEIYRELAKRLNVQPANCLFIDDKPRNIAGAQQASMQAIHFTGHGELINALAVMDIEGLPA